MSEDAWLYSLRSEPSPDFQRQLRERLRAEEFVVRPRREWARRAFAAAAAAIIMTVLISVPGVRSGFAQFISMFRVMNVVPVSVDANRLKKLKAENLEIGALIGEQVEVLKDSGPAVSVGSVADAGTAAGMTVALPQWLPDQTRVTETSVMGERALRLRANAPRLQQVMDALGINDLKVPAGLDGRVVNVRVPPVVSIRYEHGERRTRLIQARSPEVMLDGNLDLRALGEIGLRILGMTPQEARQFSQAIDWHGTLIVPVPPNPASFRQVKIGGHTGVVVQHQPRNGEAGQTVVWSTGERVFALVSTQSWEQVLAMADSVR